MVIPKKLNTSLEDNIRLFKEILPINKSFDIITRELSLGSTPCYFMGMNGMCDLQTIFFLFAEIEKKAFPAHSNDNPSDLPQIIKDQFLYAQITFSSSPDEMIQNLLSGPCLLLIDGYQQALIIDTRKYPTRNTEEPDTEKVIQGAKDGFTETLLTNCNLIRRRLRHPGLTFSLQKIGTLSQTDIAIAYLEEHCDKKILNQIKRKLQSLNTSALTMGIHSLKELLIPKNFFHPMPSAFITSRPDVACSYLAEGYILLLADTSPFALILPCNIFQFTQSPEDYYKSPLLGTYTRIVRLLCLLISLLLMPLFLLFCLNPELLPSALQTLIPENNHPTAIFIYILFVELGLDLFKYASAHSANAFSGSFAIVGGLLLGDMAVKLNWANEEVIFYGAATLLASLGISNIELSDAIKMYRLLLILMTGFLSKAGFFIGVIIIFISLLTTPVFGHRGYFWPLLPFHWKSLRTLLFRFPTFRAQPEDKQSPPL